MAGWISHDEFSSVFVISYSCSFLNFFQAKILLSKIEEIFVFIFSQF
jgi:hypothetical protein